MGRGTQSAAMVNAIELRKDLNAILVGEPSGTKPNYYSENDELRLPNSRLQVSYSTRYYKLQDQDTPSLMPDRLIEPSWETYPGGTRSGDRVDPGPAGCSGEAGRVRNGNATTRDIETQRLSDIHRLLTQVAENNRLSAKTKKS